MLRYIPILPLLLFVGAFQTPTDPGEAYPGQHSHAKPPEGWYCSADAKNKAHVCHCKRMVERWAPDPDNDFAGDPPKEQDPLCEETHVKEDPTCTVYCHPQACLCKVEGCEKDGGHAHHH